jgi:hypothetical protein
MQKKIGEAPQTEHGMPKMFSCWKKKLTNNFAERAALHFHDAINGAVSLRKPLTKASLQPGQ